MIRELELFKVLKSIFGFKKIFSNFILKIMKIKFLKSMMAVVILASMSSCATLFGGPITAYQKTKPAPGKPERELRAGALILDIVLFWPAAIVDFSNGAIYKPKPTK
jgi:hypothetical protein